MASSGEKVLYFLVGGFVGAAVGLLLAPKSGHETREFLENRYREGADRLRQKAREGRETLGSKYQESREAVSGKYGSVADRFAETIDKGKQLLDRQKDQLAAALEAGRQAYEEQKKKLEQSRTGDETETGETQS